MAGETRITKVLEDHRRALTASLADTQAVLARDAEAAKARVEKRKTLANSLQLSERLLEIYEEVKYYPSWLYNAPDSVCPLVTDVEAPTEPQDKLQVRFTFREKRYTFGFDGHWTTFPDGDRGYYADLSLLDPANEVLYTVLLERDEYSTSRFIDIKAFVAGSWITDFIDLSEHISAIKQKSSMKWEVRKLEDEKRRFGLDRDEAEVVQLERDLRVSLDESVAIERVGPAMKLGRLLGRFLGRSS